jgi:long-chain acyl-CoA synthetase
LIKDYQGMTTLKQIFDKNVKEVPEKPFLGTRDRKFNEKGEVEFGEYKWKNYSTVHKESLDVANYLITKGLCPTVKTADGDFKFISIYAKNREEWILTDLACVHAGITSVTLYDTLGKDSIEYILDQTQIKTVVCEADKVKNIINLKKEGKIKTVTHVIYFDDIKNT